MRCIRQILLLGMMMTLMACGAARQSGICGELPPAATATGDAAASEAEGNAAWEKRGDEAELRKAMTAWQQALSIDPSRGHLRVKLARAHYFLADGHLRFDEMRQKEMLESYRDGTNHAELALGQEFPKYRAKFCARQPYSVALQQLDKEAIPAIYWYSTNLGKYALASSIVEVLNQKDRIKAMMELVYRIEPGFFKFAADRYLGAFYTKIPFPGGALPRSKGHFSASAEKAPEYLATKVLFAEMYAIKAKDRALFQSLLDEVVAFDVETLPEFKPENLVEQRKARDLLEEVDIYFPED